MDKRELLPESSLFEADGHVTEVVLTCLADGELGLVPAAASAHLDACAACTERLGRAALASLEASEALRELAIEPEAPAVAQAKGAEPSPGPLRPVMNTAAQSSSSPSWRARRRPPYAAIAAALFIAAAAAAPGAIQAAAALPRALRLAMPLIHVALLLLRRPTGAGGAAALALNVGSALVLITIGSLLGRAASRARSLEGGLG